MKAIKILIATLICALPSSAALADLMENELVPKEEAQFARDFLEQLRTGHYDGIAPHLDPELAKQVNNDLLDQFVETFPEGEYISTELIGSHVRTVNDVWNGNFVFEYHFSGGWAVADLNLTKQGDNRRVVGFHIMPTNSSQKAINKFSLKDKSATHYVILILAVLVPLFILVTLAFCIRTPIPKWKWLWVLFILGGIGTVTLNWSTGEVATQTLHYLLFGASAFASSEYAPWMISVGIPVGAVIFWVRRKQWIEDHKAAKNRETA
ncbi:hypothetical protein [Microbulbifer hainanensis]|uniref:hypothetical protein n=1 Tax=Microbulbifer hainanensis TaxID=2735675 RepID=UPI001865D870|nr:hypothetical protein [Microbulbifer hainanensis]